MVEDIFIGFEDAKRMIKRTMDRFDLYPARLAGDSGLRIRRDAELARL